MASMVALRYPMKFQQARLWWVLSPLVASDAVGQTVRPELDDAATIGQRPYEMGWASRMAGCA